MKPKIIDISVSIKEKIPVWPKSLGVSLQKTQIKFDLHVGTHIDAPLHFVLGGDPLNKIPLEKLIGQAFIAYLPKVKAITAQDLEKLRLPKNTVRLLFRTSNSNLWQKKQKEFQRDFVGLTSDGARWIVKKGIQLVGIDYLSIAKYEETAVVHRILLRNKVVIIEGLDLFRVNSGLYQLICLPLKFINTEAASARAVLLPW